MPKVRPVIHRDIHAGNFRLDKPDTAIRKKHHEDQDADPSPPSTKASGDRHPRGQTLARIFREEVETAGPSSGGCAVQSLAQEYLSPSAT